MTTVMRAKTGCGDEAIDTDFERQAEQLAREFDRREFLVTLRREVDVNGAAELLSVSTDRLRQWRSTGATRRGGDGPPCRVVNERALYSLRGLLLWIEQKETRHATVIAGDGGAAQSRSRRGSDEPQRPTR